MPRQMTDAAREEIDSHLKKVERLLDDFGEDGDEYSEIYSLISAHLSRRKRTVRHGPNAMTAE